MWIALVAGLEAGFASVRLAAAALAGALPALGIVACVLGVVKTMGAIDQPPAVLGALIGSALVGTFMGVFLAYGLIGPMATRLKHIVDEDAMFYHVIRNILVAHLHGNSAQVSVEIGRGSVPSLIISIHARPASSCVARSRR